MTHNHKTIWRLALLPALTALAGTVLAQPHVEEIEEIIVSAPFQESAAETALPLGVLSGEELREKVGNSLGDTLKNEIGINSASFGTGVGHPVIRGQTGNRVSVLQNGVGVTDASNLSPDHAEGVEAVLAERLEVIRGPSTLLYGSGAVGGVVNVIDNRIPEELVEAATFSIEQSHHTVNDADQTVFRLDGRAGPVAININAFTRDNNNVEIDGFAIDEAAVEALEEILAEHAEEGHDEEGHDEEGHEEEEFDNTRGFIGNSDAEAEGGSVGASYIGDRGFIGFSISELDNNYGLPPGAHGHHEEEGHEEEGEDDGVDEEGHEEEVEFVRIDMEKTRYDARGMLQFANSWIDNIRASVGYTDYEHREVETFEDGGTEIGTLFSNEGVEGRVTLSRAETGAWSGVYGLQFSDTDFSAIGEEAFIPPAEISDTGLFGVERYSGTRASVELGLRVEDNEVETGQCAYDETSVSVSGSLLYDLDGNTNLLLGLSRSERAPSVEELFSNVSNTTCQQTADDEDLILHAATGLLEIGNAELDEETANNIEIGLRRHSGSVTGELSAYYNEIDDYIFLDLSGEEFEEQPIARYLQRDANFTGLEGRLSLRLLEAAGGTLELGFFGDLVDAEFDAGGNVPRIPPAKLGAELRYFSSNWSLHLHATRALEQDDAGELELPTDSYTLLSLYADYHWVLGDDSELKVFLRGDNLLDEEIRNHASFLKNFAPEPGRGFRLGLRFEY